MSQVNDFFTPEKLREVAQSVTSEQVREKLRQQLLSRTVEHYREIKEKLAKYAEHGNMSVDVNLILPLSHFPMTKSEERTVLTMYANAWVSFLTERGFDVKDNSSCFVSLHIGWGCENQSFELCGIIEDFSNRLKN